MPPEVLERAFDPFFTTKPAAEGTGLGLPTVYGIVTQAGGQVTLHSQVGRGTRVLVHLPVVSEEVADVSRSDDVQPVPAAGQTILLVDDEDAVRRMTARILSAHGYRIVEASGGEEALAAYRSLPAPPDLVLTDVTMPRMSGIDLARRLEAEPPPVPPVILMSGYSGDASTIQDALGRSAGFVQKPFDSASLLHRVGVALAERERPV
jgi:CheY-like chemotaxis protein